MPTPGAIGGFHEAFRFGATMFYGAPDAAAVGAAIVLHAFSVGPSLLLGLFFAAQAGLNLAGMRQLADQAEETAARNVMKCPYCGHLGDKVVDSRESKEGEVIRRRRECLECGKRFTSYERIDEIPYMVVKKDGTRERFERQKLVGGSAQGVREASGERGRARGRRRSRRGDASGAPGKGDRDGRHRRVRDGGAASSSTRSRTCASRRSTGISATSASS